MEVIVREGKVALSPRQRKDDLGQLGRMMMRILVQLQEVLQGAITLLHDGGHDRDIRDLGPRKGLIAILTDILLETGGFGSTITGLDLLDLRGAGGRLRVVLLGQALLNLRGLIGHQRGGRRRAVRHAIQLRNVVQLNILAHLQDRALCARMLELRRTRLRPDLQLKGLAQVVSKPWALRELLLVIRNVQDVLFGNAAVHALDLGKVRASGLGQHQAGQGAHIGSRMRTLKLVLNL